MKFAHFAVAAALGALAFAAAPVEHAAAYQVQTSSLSGQWTGIYAGGGNEPTSFEGLFAQAGANISGSMFEYNGFGDTAAAAYLTSTISGTVQGDLVRFTKTYDGTGGVSHAVHYEGRLVSNGRRIRGTWNADGASGGFEMVR